MSCGISFHPLKALPSLNQHALNSILTTKLVNFSCNSSTTHQKNNRNRTFLKISCSKHEDKDSYSLESNKCSTLLTVQIAALSAIAAAEPALAVTGVNNEPDFKVVIIKIGIVAFWYFLIMPPIIMNWLRIRWYRRGLVEMYFQFLFVFMFFPGCLVWAPFLNFRKFPRDPSMKYPWSKPENPSQIKGGRLKYPWATYEDYE